MNANNRSVSNTEIQEALSAGAELWVIQNKPESSWWQELDYRSRYLLSQSYFHSKKQISKELLEILKATNLQEIKKNEPKNFILIGSSDHFLNKWILVWNDMSPTEVCTIVESLAQDLNFSSARFFSDSDQIKQVFQARPTASSLTISYIE
jgi:hypothetical protein